MSLSSCGNSRHPWFPGAQPQTIPVLAGAEWQPLCREPESPVSHVRVGLAGALLQPET